MTSHRYRIELLTPGDDGQPRVLYMYGPSEDAVKLALIDHGIREVAALVHDGDWDPVACAITPEPTTRVRVIPGRHVNGVKR